MKRIVLIIVLTSFFTTAMFAQNQTINGSLDIKNSLYIKGEATQLIHLRPNKGFGSYIYWAENGVAERGVLGYAAGSGDLVYRSGAYNLTNGSERFRIASNGNVGIGVSTPLEKLHVNGNLIFDQKSSNHTHIRLGHDANDMLITDNSPENNYGGGYFFRVHNEKGNYNYIDAMTITKDANVGIGTMAPEAKLDVNGSLRVRGFALIHNGADFILGNNDGRPKGKKESQRALVHGKKDELIINYNGDFEGGVLLGSNVGIGTNPVTGYGLAVSGKMITEEVLVQLKSTWPDFVFKKDYNLPSLAQVERHINKKGHLADIPSAKEVKENGVQLGEMNKKLLQKIEELTLYTIQQEKKLKAQENKLNELDDLKNRLVKLEKLLTAKK